MHCKLVDLRYGWATPRGSASQMRPWSEQLGERRLKASRPVITPSWPTSFWPKRLIGRHQEALLCAKAKR